MMTVGSKPYSHGPGRLIIPNETFQSQTEFTLNLIFKSPTTPGVLRAWLSVLSPSSQARKCTKQQGWVTSRNVSWNLCNVTNLIQISQCVFWSGFTSIQSRGYGYSRKRQSCRRLLRNVSGSFYNLTHLINIFQRVEVSEDNLVLQIVSPSLHRLSPAVRTHLDPPTNSSTKRSQARGII